MHIYAQVFSAVLIAGHLRHISTNDVCTIVRNLVVECTCIYVRTYVQQIHTTIVLSIYTGMSTHL